MDGSSPKYKTFYFPELNLWDKTTMLHNDTHLVLRFGGDWSSLINRLANDVHDPAERLGSHRDSDGGTSIQNLLATHQTLSTVHSNSANSVLTF